MADNTLKREVDELKEELSQLRENMGDLVSVVKDLGQSAAHTTRTNVKQELDERLQQLSRAYVSARKTSGGGGRIRP